MTYTISGRVVGLTLAAMLLMACGSGGTDTSADLPAGVLHITGVDGSGRAVDVRIQPFQEGAEVSLMARDNEVAKFYSAQVGDDRLLAFSDAMSSVSHTGLVFRLQDERGELSCFGGCELNTSLDVANRKMTVRFPGEYQFLVGDRASGKVRVSGALVLGYDPDWVALQSHRFPEMPVAATISINGEVFVVSSMSVFGGLHGDGFHFRGPDEAFLRLGTSFDGEMLRVEYQDIANAVTYRADVSFAGFSHIDGRYHIALDDLLLERIGGGSSIGISLDVVLPEVEGEIVVAGAAEGLVLSPRTYDLSVRSNERRYEFTMADEHGQGVSLVINEKAGVIGPVQLIVADGTSYECGQAPLPDCQGINFSVDGYIFSFMATAMSDGLTLNGSLRHAGVRTLE